MNKLILKLTWKQTGLRIAKIILEKNKVGELILSDFKTFHKATQWCGDAMRTDRYIYIYLWTRTESLQINLYIYCQLTRVMRPFNGKRIVSINGGGTAGYSHAKE